jgi:hypothetical protein
MKSLPCRIKIFILLYNFFHKSQIVISLLFVHIKLIAVVPFEEQASKDAIVQFSESLAIHPSILLGRLQKDDKVNYSYLYELKTKYLVKVNRY